MIDRLSFYINDYNPYCNNSYWLKKESEFDNKELFGRIIFNKRYKKKRHSLKLLLTVNYKTRKLALSVTGSIRKWYFQENSNQDLSFDELIDCLELLSEELSIDYKILLESKITQLEIGINILLKSKMKSIIHCFQKYRNGRREIYKRTTLYFRFTNYKLVFYDKFLEIKKNKIWNQKDNLFFKKFYLLRFKISINKLSGTKFKNKFNTIDKIIKNWKLIPQVIYETLNSIVFVDIISKEKEPEINNYVDLINFISFIGLKNFGIEKSIRLFDDKIISSNKSKMLNKFLDIYRSNIINKPDLKTEFLLIIKKKLNSLYNKSNIKYNRKSNIIIH